jgi:hypothetical protein
LNRFIHLFDLREKFCERVDIPDVAPMTLMVLYLIGRNDKTFLDLVEDLDLVSV